MNKRMLMLLAAAMVASCIRIAAGEADAAAGIGIVGPEGFIAVDEPPYMSNGSILVPVNVMTKLGLSDLSLQWDNKRKQATITRANETISLTINEASAVKADGTIPLSVPATIRGGRMMAPARFIGEVTGERVSWEAGARTVTIGDVSAVDAEMPLTEARREALELPIVELEDKLNAGGLMTVVAYFPAGESDRFFVKRENRIDYYEAKNGKAYQLWAAKCTNEIAANDGLPFFPYKLTEEIGTRPHVKGSFVYFKTNGAIAALYYGIIDGQGQATELGEGDTNNGSIVDIPQERDDLRS